MERQEGHLDPVTFEVLKNAFVNLVDQMSEQILEDLLLLRHLLPGLLECPLRRSG